MKKQLNVLIGCEHSGVVREAFRKLGHNAWSCDFLPADDNSEFHFQCDVREPLAQYGWDVGIFHPDCTYLTVAGLHWNKRGRLVDGRPRAELTEEALQFVEFLLAQDIPHTALENPIGCISTRIRKPEQIIQPYEFGDDASKATCLWLKGLPPLKATRFVEPRWVCCGDVLPEGVGKHGCANCNGEKAARPRWANQTDSGQNRLPPSDDRWKLRSLTYQGIADAMAQQWSDFLCGDEL
jgi:hypothetical protein